MKQVYQADDGKTFDTPEACLFYEAMEGCQYVYISNQDRKYLADHLYQKLYTKETPNETLSSSLSSEQDPSKSLDAPLRAS